LITGLIRSYRQVDSACCLRALAAKRRHVSGHWCLASGGVKKDAENKGSFEGDANGFTALSVETYLCCLGGQAMELQRIELRPQ
jgi:hypothetical protein